MMLSSAVRRVARRGSSSCHAAVPVRLAWRALSSSSSSSSSGSSSGKGGSSSVYTWGQGNNGELGHPEIVKSGLRNAYVEDTPKLVQALEGLGVTHLSCSAHHSSAIDKDGRMLTWGKNDHNVLSNGTPDKDICRTPKPVEGLAGVRLAQAALGEMHSAVLSEDGELFTWGWGGNMLTGASALGLGSKDSHTRPQRVTIGGSADVRLKAISSGKRHMLGLGLDGEVWVWGRGDYGLMGNASAEDQLEPVPVELLLELDVHAVQVSCGQDFCMVLSDSGEVYVWGRNDQSQLGLGGGLSMDVYAMENFPRVVEGLQGEHIVHVAAGTAHAVAVSDKGEVYHWGYRAWLEPHKMTSLKEKRIVSAACGSNFSCVLSDAGEVFTWGKGLWAAQSGILAQGDKKRHALPELVQSLSSTPVQLVACGHTHAAALTGLPSIGH